MRPEYHVPPPRHPAPSRQRVSLRTLCSRAHMFGITIQEVLACATVEAVQRLVKQRYRALAREVHPDAMARRKAAGLRPALVGETFRRLTFTYTFLMALDPTQGIDRTAGLTIPEAPAPWAWDRASLSLGEGYHEIPPDW